MLNQLVYLPDLLNHPNFELEVVMVEEDEVRVFEPGRVRRRKGWRIVRRQLNAIVERHRFRRLDDLLDLLEAPLPDPFTTLELAAALNQPRRLAQKMAYIPQALIQLAHQNEAGVRGDARSLERDLQEPLNVN